MTNEDRDARIGSLEQDNARLRRLLDTQGIPGTLRHQVRNTLGVMRGILRILAANSNSVDEYAANVESRFDALSRVQTLLIAALDHGAELGRIVADELAAHLIQEGEQLTLEGTAVRLEPRAAEVVAIAIHELTLNAIKFGAMSAPGGRIAVSWSVSGDPPMLEFVWSEQGSPASSPPLSRGFGFETLENMLPYQLGAETELQFQPEGLICTVKLPLRKGQRQIVLESS